MGLIVLWDICNTDLHLILMIEQVQAMQIIQVAMFFR